MSTRTLTELADRAPSMYNTRPWRLRFTGTTVEVRIDRTRSLPVGDPTGRAARVACGCAVFNLRMALAVAGTPAEVRLFPAEDVAASLVPAPARRPPTPVERRLYAAIPRRHSNRYPFTDVAVPASVLAELERAARAENCWLDVASLDTVADLVAEADRTLRADPAYVAELRTVEVPDGGPAPDQFELLTRRDFGGAAGDRAYEREPLLAVLGATGDLSADDVVAGMALQRVLLTATDLGLAASMFTQPIDVAPTRDRLRVACGRPYPPHAVLRFGYA